MFETSPHPPAYINFLGLRSTNVGTNIGSKPESFQTKTESRNRHASGSAHSPNIFVINLNNNICYGRDCNFVVEDCFELNCTLRSFVCFPK